MSSFNIKKGWAAARINLKSLRTVFVALSAVFVVSALPGIFLSLAGGNVEGLGFSTLIYAFALIVPIALATTNFHKTMRLGAKKKDYFVGVLMILSLLAAVISFTSITLYYCIDKPVTDNLSELYSLYRVFGFAANGVFIGFFQQFGFLFLLSVAVFLFTNVQDNWKGWLADVLLVLFVVVTLPITVLRESIWAGLIYVTITGHPAAQICFTIFGGIALYLSYLLILKRKRI